MALVSMDPAASASESELLPNGDFGEWYGGLAYPTDFEVPQNGSVSRVERDLKSGQLGTSGYTARQNWTAFDIAEPPPARFGTTVELEANTAYLLSIVAAADAGMASTVDAYRLDGSRAPLLLAGNIVEIQGEGSQRFEGRFYNREKGPVLLRSRASPLANLPGAVTWSTWSLRPSNLEVEMPAASQHDTWVQNSMDHVQGQFALYGGTGAWAKALYPLQKNLGRIYRETGAQEGSAILGYGQYVFQKTELAYARNVRDFVRTSVDGVPAYRPSFRALLQLDRQLAKREIELVLVPLPDRIHLYADRVFTGATDLPPSYLPHTRLVSELLTHGAHVVDLGPLMMHLRAEGQAVYWRGDYGVPSDTLAAISRHIAPLIKPANASGPGFVRSVEEMPLYQRAVLRLPTEQRKMVDAETRQLHKVRKSDESLFEPAERSSVLVPGALGTVYAELGASFAAQLSHDLGYPVSVPARPLKDQEIPAYLAQESVPELEGTHTVVFCFPEYTLLRPGW
jgi:hypothetical protein